MIDEILIVKIVNKDTSLRKHDIAGTHLINDNISLQRTSTKVWIKLTLTGCVSVHF